MKHGRVVWIAISALGWASWLAAGTVFIWHWMDGYLAMFLSSTILVVVRFLETVGIKRALLGNGEDDEQIVGDGPLGTTPGVAAESAAQRDRDGRLGYRL